MLRPMASGDAAALEAYRSDPVQARYKSWETPYPVDSAQALIAEMREVRFASLVRLVFLAAAAHQALTARGAAATTG